MRMLQGKALKDTYTLILKKHNVQQANHHNQSKPVARWDVFEVFYQVFYAFIHVDVGSREEY